MQKEQDREAIYRSIFFCDMDRKKADEIINRLDGRTVTYDKGEIIIREREKLNNIGILLDGVLCKVQYYRDGTEQLVQKLVSSFVVGVEIAVSEKRRVRMMFMHRNRHTFSGFLYGRWKKRAFWICVRGLSFTRKRFISLQMKISASAGRLNCCRSEESGKESSSI